jgi:hypothetical protein
MMGFTLGDDQSPVHHRLQVSLQRPSVDIGKRIPIEQSLSLFQGETSSLDVCCQVLGDQLQPLLLADQGFKLCPLRLEPLFVLDFFALDGLLELSVKFETLPLLSKTRI